MRRKYTNRMRPVRSGKAKLIAGMLMGAAVWLATGQFAPGQNTNKVIPVLQMEGVPLTTVIENLARLSGQNYLFDPRAYGPTPNGPYHDRDGRVISEPLLTFTWKNMTARQALARVLQESNLYAVEMQNTPILQISRIRQDAGIVDAALLGNDTNAFIPVIQMQSVSIGTALKRLARSAGLTVVIDPELFKFSDAEAVASTIISLHWEGVTPRQAIIAVCENFGLDIVKDATTGVIHIEPKR